VSVAEHGQVEVDGCMVHWTARGPLGAEAVVLVHGGAANQYWWDAVIPKLRTDRRIVAMDLTGHGASGVRGAYDAETWASEIRAVVEVAACGRAAVVGHSMGGRVAIVAAASFREHVEGLILVDVPIELPPGEPVRYGMSNRRRIYDTREAAVGAFRVVPPQPVRRPEVLRYVAEHSVAQAPDGGWLYVGDPLVVMGRVSNETILSHIPELSCPVAVIRGAQSVYDNELCAELVVGSSQASVTVLSGAGHHVMLDDPEALGDAIETHLDRFGRLSPAVT
jgi:pimeloyl-ACP methyl ester carboxylesterase